MRKSTAMLVVLVFLSASCLTVSLSVKAEPRTITVPDDYTTIQEAITNANSYDTIFVRAGTHEGPINQTLTIDKPLSLVGESTESTIMNLYPAYNVTWIFATPFFNYSDAIAIYANEVNIKNFTIVPRPSGDIYVGGDKVKITGNNITRGLTIAGSHSYVAGNTIGYRFTLKNTSLNFIEGNSVSECFYMEYADSNLIANNTCNGFTIGYYGYTCSSNIVVGNILKGDDFLPWGIGIDNSGTDNVFACNNVSGYPGLGYGGWGVSLASYAVNNTFYHNNFFDNKINAAVTESANFWDDGNQGNYWDDYAGTDHNSDGVGDTTYLINANNIDRYPLMSPFDINSVSIELPPWATTILNPQPTHSPEPTPEPEPFPTTLLIGSAIAMAAVVGLGLLVCLKKRQRNKRP
jgi:Periplasmic copper-binding protein (NosD)